MSKQVKIGLAIGGISIAAAIAAFMFSRDFGTFASIARAKSQVTASHAPAGDVNSIGSIFGKPFNKVDLTSAEKLKLFDAETQVFGAFEELLARRYLTAFFEKYAKDNNIADVNTARETYIKSKVNVPDAQIKQIVEQYKNSEQLKNLTPEQQIKEVRQALEGQYKQGVVQSIIAEGKAKGELAMAMQKPVEPRIEVTDAGNPSIGDKNAPVTIIEFADYQCPYCARVVPILLEVVKKYEGKVRWVYRDFPLDFHPNAMPAAIVANCAGAQGGSDKYFEAHNILFENHTTLGEPVYAKLVETLKLDKAKFEACRKDPATKAEITSDYEAGQAIGVNGTPMYFINGRRMGAGRDATEFSRVIDEELAKK